MLRSVGNLRRVQMARQRQQLQSVLDADYPFVYRRLSFA